MSKKQGDIREGTWEHLLTPGEHAGKRSDREFSDLPLLSPINGADLSTEWGDQVNATAQQSLQGRLHPVCVSVCLCVDTHRIAESTPNTSQIYKQ